MKMHVMPRMLIMPLAVMLLSCVLMIPGAKAEEYTYDSNCEYILETFGLEDTAYYPYLPMHIDPVSYSGSCSMAGGLNGDTYYAGYSCYTPQAVEEYLHYLEYWGYQTEKVPCAIPDMSHWHLSSTGTDAERRPLVPEIDVYHAADRELLIAAYSYLDAWLYDAWLEKPEWGWLHDPFVTQPLPCTVQLREDAAITVEEVRLTRELYIIAEEELSVFPYNPAVLEERDLKMSSFRIDQSRLHHWRYDRKSTAIPYLPCVRISFDESLRDEILHSLRAATADADQSQYGDCVDVCMMLLSQHEEDDNIFTADLSAAKNEVWLIFPPGCGIDTLQRFYFCLEEEGNPWIGDLRDWPYMNVYLTEKQLADG